MPKWGNNEIGSSLEEEAACRETQDGLARLWKVTVRAVRDGVTDLAGAITAINGMNPDTVQRDVDAAEAAQIGGPGGTK